jgi:phosphoglycolate phosphatase
MLQAALAEALVEPVQAVMIGDTQYDMAMAVGAGVRAIGVEWGYHTGKELREAGADAVVASTAELKELLR